MGARFTLLLLALLAGLSAGVGASSPEAAWSLDALLRRATFGETPAERERALTMGSRGWLQEQLHPPPVRPHPALVFPHEGRTAGEVFLHQWENDYRITATGQREVDSLGVLESLTHRRLAAAVGSRYQLREVMVDFWFNHFNVDWGKGGTVQWGLPEYVEGSVRPHALGRFRDLLGAVSRSPAMLVYLDNWLSSATSEGGLNENYARELLELHTVGVEAGYTQADVLGVARCFSGWSVGEDLAFEFDALRHDDGPKLVMELALPAGGGLEDGERVLDYLAAHPATARRLSRKLARRFVSDDPPEELVERAARTWTRTDGDVARVLEVLLTSPEFAAAAARRSKVKTPLELVASTMRVLDVPPAPTHLGDVAVTRGVGPALDEIFESLGAPLFRCPLPIGFPDRAEDWNHPGSLNQRILFVTEAAASWGRAFMARQGLPPEVGPLAARVFPGGASSITLATARQLASAAPPDERGVRILEALLASPEFATR